MLATAFPCLGPLLEVSDLPRFLIKTKGASKPSTVGTVRMETPVIYFYSDSRQIVSVDVGNRAGVGRAGRAR